MKINIKNFKIAIALFVVTAVSLTGCTKEEGSTDSLNASLSFINSVEGSAAQDIYINDVKVSSSAVAYGNVSSDISSTTGTRALSFKNTS